MRLRLVTYQIYIPDLKTCKKNPLNERDIGVVMILSINAFLHTTNFIGLR
ncbi:hypothetical protein [Legionella pneumophila]|nr:hypothetical protein [Legionella pneumophila]CZG73210.1 Uncharacterised protein [Legionella pneumophila]CZG77152.1 Uncharacterised protein [Legionella pneumophila]CZG95519.1 Uncharacterised protein [Legionella pneumophila]